MSPGLASRIKFQIAPCGERQPKAKPAESRRVEIFIPVGVPGSQKPIPPDHTLCGVPRHASGVKQALEIQQLERETPAVTVRSRLCLYQNASQTSHRNHFNCQATRWARRISAIAAPDAANCRRRVGSTPYDTGADIIRAIAAARQCLKRAVEVVHIFSHSGSYGIFGTTSGGSVGLYTGSLDSASRSGGGRTVPDIPTASLVANVVFVLHGCNAASGTDNFARALYQHLSASLQNPRVFGHDNSGCAGRDNSWREYSNAAPTGRRVRSIAPLYAGDGCCSSR
jgi:hypothetical protein